MSTYTVKNAILDLGFIEGCLQSHIQGTSPREKYIWGVFDRIEQRITLQNLDSAQMLYDLGIIRGAHWLASLPGSYSDAMDRLMEFFVHGKVDWYQLPQPFTGMEHEDPLLSDELRDEIYSDYVCESRERAIETIKRAGFEEQYLIDRIVPPRVKYPEPPKPACVDDTKQEGIKVSAAWVDANASREPEPCHALQADCRVEVPSPAASLGRREWTPEQRAAQAERARTQHKTMRPHENELETVKADWESGVPFDAIGRKFGCSGSHIRNFLSKHGIDPRRSVAGTHKGRPPLSTAEVQFIIDEKAKGTPSKEIGEMIDRSQHAVDQKYSDLKKLGMVPEEHLTPEVLKEKKSRQNKLVSGKMKEFHAGKHSQSDADEPSEEEPSVRNHLLRTTRPQAGTPNPSRPTTGPTFRTCSPRAAPARLSRATSTCRSHI